MLSEDPTQYFAIIIAVVLSIVLHELAHGWAAIKLGDNTPIETGHMTLNPLIHMGWISLILLAVVGIAFGAMPVNPSRLRGKYAEALVALAGPAVNLILAIGATIAWVLWVRYGGSDFQVAPAKNGLMLLQMLSLFNFALFLFNLLPIPPLDGFRVLANFVPSVRQMLDNQVAQGVMMAVFFAMFLGGARYIFMAASYLRDHLVYYVLRLTV